MSDIAERIAKLKEVICSIGWYRPGHADAIAYVRKNTLPIIEALVKERDILREMTRCAEHRDDESNANGCPGCVQELVKEREEVWLPLLEAATMAVTQIERATSERLNLLTAMDKAREALK